MREQLASGRWIYPAAYGAARSIIEYAIGKLRGHACEHNGVANREIPGVRR